MSIVARKHLPYGLLAISGLIAASDQVVKWSVQQSMAYGESIPVTPFFNWVHVWNTGAAFSLFADGGGWQRYFLISVAVVVSIVGSEMCIRDRIFRGYVVDSFDVYWQSWHWPAFNLADIAIVLGTVLFLYVSFIPEKSGTNVELDGSG